RGLRQQASGCLVCLLGSTDQRRPLHHEPPKAQPADGPVLPPSARLGIAGEQTRYAQPQCCRWARTDQAEIAAQSGSMGSGVWPAASTCSISPCTPSISARTSATAVT